MTENFFARLLFGHRSDARTVAQLSVAASKGEQRALEGLLDAAQSGNGEAQAELGYLYAKGLGVPQSTATAMSWYVKAADNGNLNAQFNLGVIYFKGDGHETDLSKAMVCFQKAAAGGHARAASLIPVVQFAMQTEAMEQATHDGLGTGIVAGKSDAMLARRLLKDLELVCEGENVRNGISTYLLENRIAIGVYGEVNECIALARKLSSAGKVPMQQILLAAAQGNLKAIERHL